LIFLVCKHSCFHFMNIIVIYSKWIFDFTTIFPNFIKLYKFMRNYYFLALFNLIFLSFKWVKLIFVAEDILQFFAHLIFQFLRRLSFWVEFVNVTIDKVCVHSDVIIGVYVICLIFLLYHFDRTIFILKKCVCVTCWIIVNMSINLWFNWYVWKAIL
jgi:hypothetical protein